MDTKLKPAAPSQTFKGPMTAVMFFAHLLLQPQCSHGSSSASPLSSGRILSCPSPSTSVPELLPGLKGQSGQQKRPVSEDNIIIYHIKQTMY